MTGRAPRDGGTTEIFRRQAWEHRFRAAVRQGEPLRLSSAPMRWSFWLVLGAIGASLLLASTVPVDEFASGSGVVRIETPGEGTAVPSSCSVTAYFPVRHLPRLRPGLSARVRLAGLDAEQIVALDAVERRIVPARQVHRILGSATISGPEEPAVPVFLRLESCAALPGPDEVPFAEGMAATVEVKVLSQSALSYLVRGFRRGAS